jgi:hypothetical protein
MKGEKGQGITSSLICPVCQYLSLLSSLLSLSFALLKYHLFIHVVCCIYIYSNHSSVYFPPFSHSTNFLQFPHHDHHHHHYGPALSPCRLCSLSSLCKVASCEQRKTFNFCRRGRKMLKYTSLVETKLLLVIPFHFQ